MSSPPRPAADSSSAAPFTVTDFARARREGQPIVMITAYDFPTAQIVDEAGVDVVLVGDSAANVVLGLPSTVPVTTDELLVLVRAVRRGLRRALLVADLPFGSYEVSDEQAVTTAIRFVKEGGAEAVKLERGGTSVARAEAIVAAGIPVVGHVGLTPQTASALGGYRAQGRKADAAVRIVNEADALELAGCVAIVLEAIPAAVAEVIHQRVDVPLIGIGAGSAVDGQVLVLHDMLGINAPPSPKFVRRYDELRERMVEAVSRYTGEVRERAFPTVEHTYPMSAAELAALHKEFG
jgi:3-methyl-2-oxobutanoate hydroxymethyltransferase